MPPVLPPTSHFSKHRTSGFFTSIERLYTSFSAFERFLVYSGTALLVVSTLFMARALNEEITTRVPAHGGSFSEAMVGSMRFVNPVLAVSDTDRALVSLLYSGLLRNVNGTLVPDLAETYRISADGKVYTVVLRPRATFHDGAPVSADDIIYTVQQVVDPNIKSSHRAEWEGVRIEKVDDRTLTFTLDKPYAGFLHSLTLGIMPKHIWQSLSAEEFPFSTYNVQAIGSGPYTYDSVSYKSDGLPASYTVRSYNAYTLGEPFIASITAIFYPNEKDAASAWEAGSVDALGGISAERSATLITPSLPHIRTTLPRTFAVFFNGERNPALADTAVREALSDLVPRGAIVRGVLAGFGTALKGPLPTDTEDMSNDLTIATKKKRALETLTKAGWAVNPGTSVLEKNGKELALSLSTANTEELKNAARAIAEVWRSVGVKVKVELYDAGDLQQTVVRPRTFDALFFGEVVPATPDLFAFWHSSQRSDPGLNIASYTNKDADKILDAMRTTTDTKEHELLYSKLAKLLLKDAPAAFVYSPTYVYIPGSAVHDVALSPSMEGYERFGGVRTWYIESDRVWDFLIK